MNTYTKTNWQDADSTATPINAANLNHMESGIEAVTDEVKNNSMRLVYVDGTDAQSVDSCTDAHTIYNVYINSGVVTTARALVICLNTQSKLVQYAFTYSEFIIFRSKSNGVWSAWDYIPTRSKVLELIDERLSAIISS